MYQQERKPVIKETLKFNIVQINCLQQHDLQQNLPWVFYALILANQSEYFMT